MDYVRVDGVGDAQDAAARYLMIDGFGASPRRHDSMRSRMGPSDYIDVEGDMSAAEFQQSLYVLRRKAEEVMMPVLLLHGIMRW